MGKFNLPIKSSETVWKNGPQVLEFFQKIVDEPRDPYV